MNEFLDLFQRLQKYVVGAEGNISMKTKNSFLIKASGLSFKDVTKENLVECDLDGTPKANQKFKPSIETSFHSYLFTEFDVNYIAHTHPANLLKILCTDLIKEFATKRLFPDQVVYNGETSCIVPYATPGNELKKTIENCLKKFLDKNHFFPKVILLQNHGLICPGRTANECVINTEICEKSANIYLNCIQLNKKINFLTNKQVKSLINDKHEKYRQKLLSCNINE